MILRDAEDVCNQGLRSKAKKPNTNHWAKTGCKAKPNLYTNYQVTTTENHDIERNEGYSL